MMDWYGNGMGAGGWVAMIVAMTIFGGLVTLAGVMISCLPGCATRGQGTVRQLTSTLLARSAPVLMSLSTIIVAINAQLLRRIDIQPTAVVSDDEPTPETRQ